jgi:hypothetical protein
MKTSRQTVSSSVFLLSSNSEIDGRNEMTVGNLINEYDNSDEMTVTKAHVNRRKQKKFVESIRHTSKHSTLQKKILVICVRFECIEFDLKSFTGDRRSWLRWVALDRQTDGTGP